MTIMTQHDNDMTKEEKISSLVYFTLFLNNLKGLS